MNFDQAFDMVIDREAGYVNDPNDPGGETNYGISKRSYPHEDIRNMTLERAKWIYRRDFWKKAKCDELPWPVNFQVFDAAVNSGVRAAVKWLQKAVGVSADGVIGPKTLAAVRSHDPRCVSAWMLAYRLRFMTALKNWPHAGKGWARRIASNLLVL